MVGWVIDIMIASAYCGLRFLAVPELNGLGRWHSGPVLEYCDMLTVAHGHVPDAQAFASPG